MALEITENLQLQPITENDATAIFQIIHRQRDYLGKWLPFVSHTEMLEDTLLFIRSTLNNQTEQVFSIYYKELLVGLIDLHNIDRSNLKADIGYWISADYQKRGIVTASVRRLIDYAFNRLDLNRLQIKCVRENLASKHIPQRLNFKREGVERDRLLLANGHFADFEIYALLKRERN